MKNKIHQHEEGQVLAIITLFVLGGSMVVVGSLFSLVKNQIRTVTELSSSKQAYILAEGVLEEVVYRHKKGMNVLNTETLSESGVSVETTTSYTPGGREVTAVGNENGRVRKMSAELIEGDGVSFSFGVQAGRGGFVLENSSMVEGNVYSNGPIIGANLNRINGTAISAGPSGYISEIHATGSAYAHTINDSYIEGDVYYDSDISGTTWDGSENAGYPDLATTSLPIDDALIDSWAAFAASSSVMSTECASSSNHITFSGDVTLGPVKIPCDVTFTGNNTTKTFSGVVWVEGNLEFLLGPEYRVHEDIGNKSIPIIVDDPSQRSTSGKIDMKNSGEWFSNGDRSYIMLVSRNTSADEGGGDVAINITNSTGGKLILYANHGEIKMRNSVSLTEITSWKLRLQQSTSVVYDSGLASSVFTAGPGGSYVIDSWKEV